MGTQVVLYDTFKVDDNAAADNGIWQTLLMDSRKVFQTCSKLDICCLTTYQLALHTVNQRYLDATCLSNGKQIKEVYETMVYMRPLWEDERTGGKYDVHPWHMKPGTNNKVREDIKLDPKEKYVLVFVDKTRADEDKQTLIYHWKAHYNKWEELGWCTVVNDHRGA